MIQRELTTVKATPERIWQILSDPNVMSRWNPHCVRCTAPEDLMRVGLRFEAVMRFGRGPERELNCEVVECQPNHSLTLRFSGKVLPSQDEYVEEKFVFGPVKGCAAAFHTVDFSHAGMPWFLRALMRMMHLVGRPKGKSPLECLKELAEAPD